MPGPPNGNTIKLFQRLKPVFDIQKVAALKHPKLPRNLARKPFPMAFGDHFDDAIAHFDGRLIVNRVRRHQPPGGPFFRVGQGICRTLWVIQVRKQRKINQSQRSIVAGGQITCRRLATEPVVVGLSLPIS